MVITFTIPREVVGIVIAGVLGAVIWFAILGVLRIAKRIVTGSWE